MNQELHDRLWTRFQRWHDVAATGVSKFDLKMKGIREHGDPNHALRPLIITRSTLDTYKPILEKFTAFAALNSGAKHLNDIGPRDFRAFIDSGIERGLAQKTLITQCSALAKFGHGPV